MSLDLKKRFSKTEYIKRFLMGIEYNNKRCAFCKYYILNYENINDAARHFFREKCKGCTERFAFSNRVKPDWVSDNFKPLYDWEPEKKE